MNQSECLAITCNLVKIHEKLWVVQLVLVSLLISWKTGMTFFSQSISKQSSCNYFGQSFENCSKCLYLAGLKIMSSASKKKKQLKWQMGFPITNQALSAFTMETGITEPFNTVLCNISFDKLPINWFNKKLFSILFSWKWSSTPQGYYSTPKCSQLHLLQMICCKLHTLSVCVLLR